MLDRDFFRKYQKQILWFANTRFGKWWLKIDEQRKLVRITPNHYDIEVGRKGKKVKLQGTFYSNNRNARRLNALFAWLPFYAYKRVRYDSEWVLRPVFGLTVTDFYSAAGANSPCDGASSKFASTWSGARDASSGDSASITSSIESVYIFRYSASQWQVARLFHLFDTSSLGSGATITSASVNLYGQGKGSSEGSINDIHIVSSNPASTNTLVVADYSTFGSTSYSSIALGSISTSGYNQFTLNASGISNITKTGVSKFGARSWGDINNNAPAGSSSTCNFYMADESGTSKDPYLRVDYSVASTADFFQLF
jgi:hypothetical protein